MYAPMLDHDALTQSETDSVAGCLLGCAVGDAIGLPYEGLSPKRIARFGAIPLRHRFVFGRGMVSDDTDHTVFVAQSLIDSRSDVVLFRRKLAWKLRLWLACLPAGIGWATLRATLKLCLGFRRSGVYSAGNGPAMRSAIIGAKHAHDSTRRRDLVNASTLLTHTDPRAYAGALAVAEIAAKLVSKEWVSKPSVEALTQLLTALSDNTDWLHVVTRMQEICKLTSQESAMSKAAQQFGTRSGVSGYVLQSVPFAIVSWYVHYGDFRATIEAVVRAGGDVDTNAAIAGALAGATVGKHGIPTDWIDGIIDRPHSVGYLRQIASSLTDDERQSPSTRFSFWLFPRGIAFTILVLLHGIRRLFPPYG